MQFDFCISRRRYDYTLSDYAARGNNFMLLCERVDFMQGLVFAEHPEIQQGIGYAFTRKLLKCICGIGGGRLGTGFIKITEERGGNGNRDKRGICACFAAEPVRAYKAVIGCELALGLPAYSVAGIMQKDIVTRATTPPTEISIEPIIITILSPTEVIIKPPLLFKISKKV